uniref:Uncharacterized protein n=1 Tax=Cannabis sativa TaxID=3483 RepID=A0A803PYH0_CANSA
MVSEENASMARPSTRSQDGVPPSTNNSDLPPDVTSAPLAQPVTTNRRPVVVRSRSHPILAASVKPPSTNPPRTKKPRPSYSNCGKPEHLVDKCFFLHDFPPGYGDKKKQDKGKAKAHQASSSTNVDTPANPTDITAQCQQLISLLSQQLTNTTARVESDQQPAAASNLAGTKIPATNQPPPAVHQPPQAVHSNNNHTDPQSHAASQQIPATTSPFHAENQHITTTQQIPTAISKNNGTDHQSCDLHQQLPDVNQQFQAEHQHITPTHQQLPDVSELKSNTANQQDAHTPQPPTVAIPQPAAAINHSNNNNKIASNHPTNHTTFSGRTSKKLAHLLD